MKKIIPYCVIIFFSSALTCAAQPAATAPVDEPEAKQDPRFEKFQQLLTGAKLRGSFTVVGKEKRDLTADEYVITKAEKMPEGDYWAIYARIKYGDKDYTVPLPLEVKWAEDTPVITMTNFTIPGQGTFSARVLFYGERYAGTWTHGEVKGHLFGTISRAAPGNIKEE